MKTYHHYMLLASLLMGAVSFKVASWFMGWAVHHRRRYLEE